MSIQKKLPIGVMTAIITPFNADKSIDGTGFDQLIRFQHSQGAVGIIPSGTTGESSTLSEVEHDFINSRALILCRGKLFVLGGCGANNTDEAICRVGKFFKAGGRAVLLVDPYYNGPSSLEIRKEYYEPIAKMFPGVAIVPYIIPGRTGCKLLPGDLAILAKKFPNIVAVKEATGDFANMRMVKHMAPEGFQIFSGDDDKTFDMMDTAGIDACGVISVISNIAPLAVSMMCQALIAGEIEGAKIVRNKLEPLFKLVTIFAPSDSQEGENDKFRNPLPIKTMMNVLGMPSGPCRRPLGKMSLLGLNKVREGLTFVWRNNPEVLKPIEEFFHVNLDRRLASDRIWAELAYPKEKR